MARLQVLNSLAPPPKQNPSAQDTAGENVKNRLASAASAVSIAQFDALPSVMSSNGTSSSWELDMLLQHFMRMSK
jgi:hypothetical protein